MDRKWCLMLDVGRVKLDLTLQEGFRLMADLYGVTVEELVPFVTSSDEFHEFERGNLFFDQYVAACNRKFGKDVDTVRFAECMEAQLAGPIHGVIALRDELRAAGVLIVTASNVNWVHQQSIRRRFPEVFNNVDVVGASCDLHVRKGDPQFFPTLHAKIDQYTGRPTMIAQQMVFVDDIRDNLEHAQVHGIRGVLFDPDHPHAVGRLREKLAQIGLPVKQIAVANDTVGESRALSA